ncbi:MAG: hypothetical protein WCG84_01380 [Candidatus Moraniibacteriota bacterium]
MHPQTKKSFSWKKWLFLFSLAGWIGVIAMIDPTAFGLKAWLAFYGALGLALYASVGWLGEVASRQEDGTILDRIRRRLNRWGVLLAMLVIGLLLLQQFRVLLWWVGLLWLAFVLLVELILYQSEAE